MIDWENHGFRICGEACDGEEALERIRELSPDLVVTDIRMPVMNGLQLIEHCTEVLNATCGFVVLSGHDDFPSARKALTCGVLDYWLKPIDVEEIHAALRKIHGEWSIRDEINSVDSPPSAQLSSVAAWNVPEEGDPLFDAEDRLMSAIQKGVGAEIDEAVGRLCRQLNAVFEDDKEAGKAFLSNVWLELTWNAAAGETMGIAVASSSSRDVSLQALPSSPDRWPAFLVPLARKAAEQLARLRSGTGPAWEAARFVRAHYAVPLQLQSIARSLHFQPAYLGELFKRHTGISFLDYVHRTRIEASRKLLRRTDLKVADIARTVGYADPEQFAAKFKQWMNITPTQYKNG